MLAGAVPSRKKRQPATSSSLLILIRAVASLTDIQLLLVNPSFSSVLTTGASAAREAGQLHALVGRLCILKTYKSLV